MISQSKFLVWRRVALVLACLVFAALKYPASARSEEAGRDAPHFSRDIQPIFDENCVTCHQAAGASGGLNLEEGAAYGSIVSHKSSESALSRVTPGQPEKSYLVRKLEGTHAQAGGSGERMPPPGPLDKALIDQIRSWVSAGAKQD